MTGRSGEGQSPQEARHRITATIYGDDLVNALCALEGCSAAEQATAVLVEWLGRAQAEDPDVQALVRARRRRRSRPRLRLLQAVNGGGS